MQILQVPQSTGPPCTSTRVRRPAASPMMDMQRSSSSNRTSSDFLSLYEKNFDANSKILIFHERRSFVLICRRHRSGLLTLLWIVVVELSLLFLLLFVIFL